jgi:hypothetical protein
MRSIGYEVSIDQRSGIRKIILPQLKKISIAVDSTFVIAAAIRAKIRIESNAVNQSQFISAEPTMPPAE